MYIPWFEHRWMSEGGILLAWIWLGVLFLIPLIPLLGLFALLKLVFDKKFHNRRKNEKYEAETPLDILKKSYARGEISRDEFLQKRDDILER